MTGFFFLSSVMIFFTNTAKYKEFDIMDKESERKEYLRMHEIKVTNQCVGCSLCVNDCPTNTIEINHGKAHVIRQDCILCGHCEAICPQAAISITGYKEKPKEKPNFHPLSPEDVLNTIRFRRTIRQFQKKEIPDEVLAQILEAGRLTHTAKNSQDISFIVLHKQKDAVEAMAVRTLRNMKPIANIFSQLARRNEIADHFFFFKAPIVIIITAKQPINGILAAQNMEFVAEANGLGVLFSGYFASMLRFSYKLRKTLHMKRGKKVAAVLVLGYPKVKYPRAPRRASLDVTYV